MDPVFEIGTDGPTVILAGVDGTPTSMHGAAWAAGLARRGRARLVVMTVLQPPAMAGLAPEGGAVVDQTLREQADDLEREVRLSAERLGIETSFVVAWGDPATEISRVADEVRADVVVVGASTKAGHRLIGSTAMRLVRVGRWPVTVIP